MGRTQDDVIAELAERRIKVNSRRLTDWRQKGLLPEMEEVRGAHGRVSYVWYQTNIVAQVEEIAVLFAYYGRISRFAHMLWLLGYEVRPELVMNGIRAPIVSMWQEWSGGASANEQLFDEEQLEQLRDTISALAMRIARRRERRPAGFPNRDDATDQVFRTMSMMIDPAYPVEDVIGELATRSIANTTQNAVYDAMATQVVQFLQRELTPRRLAEVASTASWEEFSEAGVDFGLLRDILTLFTSHLRERGNRADLDHRVWMVLRNGTLSAVGHGIIVGDMALRRAGYGRRIRAYLRLIRQRMGKSDFLNALDERVAQKERNT